MLHPIIKLNSWAKFPLLQFWKNVKFLSFNKKYLVMSFRNDSNLI